MLSFFAAACRVLALAACFLVAVQSAGTASEHTADAVETLGAPELLDAGRFEEALILLRPQILEGTVEPNTLFLYGLAAVGAAQRSSRTDEERDALLNEAIGAFHAMLVRNPTLVRVRLELARAFFLKREDGLARQHFETVLAGDVPETVKENVNLFLAEIRARDRWNFNLGVALAPDSNISGGSDERIIYIYGLPFERDAEELTTSASVFPSGVVRSTKRRSPTACASAPARRRRDGSTSAPFSTNTSSLSISVRAGFWTRKPT